MIGKAEKKTETLRKLFVNNKIPARAKTLVWLAYVRPVLEYGCEVWQISSADKNGWSPLKYKPASRSSS